MKKDKDLILIIEDEPILSEMYKEKFEKNGFSVICAQDIRKGEKLLEKKPKLVLLDILLPNEGGVIFLKRIKDKPITKKTIIIAFSNYDSPKMKEEVLSLGVRDYLLKTNHTPQEVVDYIKNILS